MAYVDGFVLPVPKKNLAAYRNMARKGGRIWLEHGALEYRECVGDDLAVKMGLPFTRSSCGRSAARPWSSPGSRTSRAPIATRSTRR